MLLICNSVGLRTFQIGLSLAFILVGIIVLRTALKGKIRSIRVFGVWVTGRDANIAPGVFAAFLIVIGIVVLVAGILKLDC